MAATLSADHRPARSRAGPDHPQGCDMGLLPKTRTGTRLFGFGKPWPVGILRLWNVAGDPPRKPPFPRARAHRDCGNP